MKAKLLVDPGTGRVVYVARDGVLPERVLIVHAGAQYLYTAASCRVVDCVVPAEIHAMNCWLYRAAPAGLELLEKSA